MIAPLPLGALALTSALATQRLPLAPPRLRSLPAARCGANGRPRAACSGSGEGRPRGRPSGHPCGHPSVHPSGRLADSPKGGFLATPGRLGALRLADISASQIDRCMSSARRSSPYISSSFVAPFALGAIAIASALATQRFSAEPRSRRLAAAWRGAGGVPLLACLAMARRGDDSCPETRRGRGRAQSARVMAIHRKEADLDRFVAALLALAAEPDGRGERRPGQPRMRTGESSRVERSCRR
jgi:hypothetical protein